MTRNTFAYIILGIVIFCVPASSKEILLNEDFNSVGSSVEGITGQWKLEKGLCRQVDPNNTTGPHIALAGKPTWNDYSVSVKLRFDSDAPYSEGGIVFAAKDINNFHVFCLSHRKAGWYVVLRTHRPALPLEFPFAGDMAMVKINPNEWHELKVDFSNGHAYCYFDKEHVVDFTFEGTGPDYYAHPPVWKEDLTKGMIGLYSSNAITSFDNLEVRRLESTAHIITPRNPRYDMNGMLVPRIPISKIVNDSIQWTLQQKEILDVAEDIEKRGANLSAGTLERLKKWDPFLVTSHVTTNDRGLTDIQYPAHNHPFMIDALIVSYAYSGEEKLIKLAQEYADWNIENCWPKESAAAGLALSAYDFVDQVEDLTNEGGRAMMTAVVEPDKSAYMGQAYLRLYGVTGNAKYLEAAKDLSETLIKLQYPQGNWPFRIRSKDGEVISEYTCNNLWYTQFFELLYQFTGEDKYKEVSERAFKWLMDNPVKTNQWTGLYADQTPDTIDQWIPLETAIYLLDKDPNNSEYIEIAEGILKFISEKLVVKPGFAPQIPALLEQTHYRVILSHHTQRLAALYAQLYRCTQNPEYKEMAVQITNSITLLAMHDGKILQGFWYHQINCAPAFYHVPDFLRILACVPDLLPLYENHLIKFTGTLKRITYSDNEIDYSFVINGSTDYLSLKQSPREILADGKVLEQGNGVDCWRYDKENHLLIIQHNGKNVKICVKED